MLTPSSSDQAIAEVALALAVAAPMLAAAAVPVSRDGLRAAAVAGWAGAAVAAAGSVSLVATGLLDPVRATLLVFAAGLAAVAVAFSGRHLDGDLRAGSYRRWLLVTSVAAVTSLVVSDVAVLAVAWVVAGRGLARLVGHHDDLPASRRAVAVLRRTQRAGDLALVVALAALVLGAGTTSVTGIAAWAASAPAEVLAVVGAGLLVATAARSAQWPFCRWLPLSVVAPAPVSALLHAGIANAPVVVLLGLFPVWQNIGWFAPALAALGLGTAALTFVRLLVRADVKTRLAWSTTAQLGFMLALLAVGAHAAAVMHLMLHGLYKANAFLRAGEHISAARRDRPLRAHRRARVGGAVAGAVTGLVVLAVDRAWHQPLTASAVIVAATAGGYGLWSWRARPAVRALAALIAVGALGLVLGGARLVASLWGLPVEADGGMAWTAAAAVGALALAGVVLRMRRPVGVWAVLHRTADPSLGLLEAFRLRNGRRTAGGGDRSVPEHDGTTPMTADEVTDLVAHAAGALPPTWSWQGFVAANPLWGSRSIPFADALAESLRADGPGAAPQRSRAETAVDDAVAGWLAVWTAPAEPAWPAPSQDLDLWRWFRTVAVRDPLVAGLLAPASSRLARPTRPADGSGEAPVRAMPERGVDLVADAAAAAVAAGWPDARAWVADELGRLVGWSAYVARRNTVAAAVDVDALVALLAVRVATRHALTGTLVPRAQGGIVVPPTPTAGTVEERSAAVLAALEAAEAEVRGSLAEALTSALEEVPGGASSDRRERPDADLVLCIDVRSERLRRHVEAIGRYRTVGFAGFFGLPLTRRTGDGPSTSRLPALLAPTLRIAAPAPEAGVRDLLRGALREALDAPGGGFGAVEVAGLRALGGTAAAVRPRHRHRAPDLRTAGSVAQEDLPQAIQAVVATARAAGIGPGSARIVVLVGHGSTSTNNTAESSYDCGACGGYRGGVNAAVAAALLNGPQGRQALADAGIPLPDDTVVVAAEHDTATDEVTLALADGLPVGHRADYQRLAASLQRAAAAVAVERCRSLPGAAPRSRTSERRAVSEVRRRAADPAQVRHEWGLAGNAFFVAAPRSLTEGLDLDGTAFLHDYDETSDADGSLLETILTAPAVVAHWINAQYLFSGLDPARWGAGSKTAHNPVGRLGVLCGAGGDLRFGLPEQAVHHRGAPPFPLVRLLVVLAAAPDRVDAVLARHPDLAALVTGDWLTLWAVRRTDGQILQRTRAGWHPAQAAGPSTENPSAATTSTGDDLGRNSPASIFRSEPDPGTDAGNSPGPDLGPGRRLIPVS
ncbi:putative inorganic carbon transporter subunit DabA [Kineosporia sp. A_224]|uniref:putative inorganic carbon transporter subunit DabA n=1 Tax=Kineosporia sp. A_224 TaxID=1962180 RepID=UPI000B4AE3C4|nr:putative inorganic carbon transporter subunit DabA [Kineosporia sp. A_224]